jgi:hypothetical protein
MFRTSISELSHVADAFDMHHGEPSRQAEDPYLHPRPTIPKFYAVSLGRLHYHIRVQDSA